MDWHRDTAPSASKLYPQTGRRGKAHSGANGKVELLREKHAKWLTKWRKAFAVRYKRAATDLEAGIALDTGTVWSDIARWTSTGMSFIIKHPDDCSCPFCLRNPDYSGPYKTVCAGLRASVDKRRDEDVKRAESVAANQRKLDLIEKANNLLSGCPFPESVWKRIEAKQLSAESLADAFNFTLEQVNELIWAKNYRPHAC